MKKILLVNPHDTTQSGFSNPPLGLLYLAGTLRSSGFDVRIVDGCLDGESSIYKALEEFNPELVGITCLTPGRHQALKIASEAKKRNPASLIVLGGSHPTIMFRQILDHYPFVDFVVRGEGEQALLELIGEKQLHDIQGLAFRDHGAVIDNGVRRPVEKLDSLPFPAWDMVDLNRYPAIDKGIYNGIDLAKVPRVSVVYSRGCSGSCHFCSSWWIWKGWRCRSAINMVDELEWLYREQNIRHFCFADDALTVDRTATLSLCEEILRRDLQIVFHTTTRSDCVDAEMLQKLKAAGCYKIAIGVESGSQTLLDRMGKSNDVYNAEHAIRLGKEAGLITTALMIVGNVGETEATISESLAFLERSQPDEIGTVGGLWILPGTRLHADCRRVGYIDDDFWLSNAPYKVYTREHSLEELAVFKNTLMQYKTVSRGTVMSSNVNRHRAGESLLSKWNRYVDSTVNEYSATSRWQGVDELHRELFEHIPAQCKDILDLGCGDGWSTNELTKLGKNAVGITINPDEAEHARETYGLILHVQDMHDIQFPDQKFDCIYCRESFEHCVAPFIALCEMNRVLKQDGYALINIPDTPWIREDSHFSVLTPAQMFEMFYKCRFKVVETGKTELGHYWYLVRKVAELDQPCPYPAPDPLSHDRETPDREAIAEKGIQPRIIGMLRIKNEAAWISEVLEKAAPLVDGFVILDDGSTDETPAICQSHPKMLRYEWQDEAETDEVRDKNRLLQWVLENDPDWVIALDGDEVLEDVAIHTIGSAIKKVSPEFTKLGISFLYMWDKNNAYRIDGHYREVRHPRIFRVSGLPVEPADLSFTPSRYGANFHCGSVPANLPGETLYIDVRVKHYGYFNTRQRASKKAFYEIRDPENAAKGYYDHLTSTQNIKLRTYRERIFDEVLQFDGTAVKAITKLKAAGNPLWQSALFYSPDCQSHLDIGSNHGSTLKGLDPENITSIEAYAPSSDLLKKRCHNVIQGDAREIVPELVSAGKTFDRITLFDFIEHIPRNDGEVLLTQLESLYTNEIILFVPFETDGLVHSEAYQQFMQRQFSRIPADQHQLQSHKSQWNPEDFERRGYSITVIENFHMPGFHAFFAYKYLTRTLTDLMQRRIARFQAIDGPFNKPATDNLPSVKSRSGKSIEKFGNIGERSHVYPPLLLTHPERIFLGNHVQIREGARLEAISQYRGETYESQICIGDGTQIELGVHIGAAKSVTLGEKVMIAGRVTILDHDHGYRNPLTAPIDQPLEVSAVVIEDGAWLGENSVVCKGVTVGRHAVVGANAVVTHDVPPWGVVAGSPARLIKFYNHVNNKWEMVKKASDKKVSIVMPVYNQVAYTRACFKVLNVNPSQNDFDIIVVNNASDDETDSYLDHFSGAIQVIRNNTNRGFVDACNQGAAAATTPYIVFLNNDTLPQNGWLEALIQTIEHYPKIGAVGSKLVYPDGRLQEAGAVVFRDGSSSNFGRYDDPANPEYNHMVEVDYCSGACLLVRKDLFDKLGGFDRRYAPAYYEETDLCFGLRQLGYKVVYQPKSIVIHVGSVTAGKDDNTGFRRFLAINREKFQAKWKNELEYHESPPNSDAKLYSNDRQFFGFRDHKSSKLPSNTDKLLPTEVTSPEETLYLQSQECLSSGDRQGAIDLLKESSERFPQFALAFNDLGILYYHQGLKDEALSFYEKAVALEPQNCNFRKNLADLLTIDKNDYETATRHYLEIIALQPTDVEALFALGYICEKIDRKQDAVDFYTQVVNYDQTHSNANERLRILLSDHPNGQYPALSVDNQVKASSSENNSCRLVFISPNLPRFDRGSSDHRNHQILDQLIQDGWEILYLYSTTTENADRYMDNYPGNITFQLLPWNTDVYQHMVSTFAPDCVFISNLWTISYAKFVQDLIQTFGPSRPFRLLLDTMDFHAKKYDRKYETSGDCKDRETAKQFKAIEKSIYPLADRVLTVTQKEAEDIKAAIPQSAPIAVLPNIHSISDELTPLDGRRHICFLGNFTVNHNVDAARYFIAEILPRIKAQRPDTEFHLIGFGSERLTDLSDRPGVCLVGPVDDLKTIMDRYRVFACPMIYGAGMKGKIGTALANGLPIVSTPIGVEGFPLQDGHDCFICKKDADFASRCLVLLDNDTIWNLFQAAGCQIIENNFNRANLSNTLKKVLSFPSITIDTTDVVHRHKNSLADDEILPNYEIFLSSIGGYTPQEQEFHIRDFLKAHPRFALAHNDLAVLCLNNGHYDDAYKHYEYALRFDPENPIFLKNHADYDFFIGGKPDSALKTYMRLHQNFPEDLEVLYSLGHIHRTRNQPDKARDFFKQIIKLDPEHTGAIEALELLGETSKTNCLSHEASPLECPTHLSALLKQRLHHQRWEFKETDYLNCIDAVQNLRTVTAPSISVVTISWRLHPDTIETFHRLQKERHLNFELIFVDNGGKLGEFDELKPFIDTYIRLNKNTGAYFARNVGALFGNSPILFFLEDDGLPAENLIASHLDVFYRYDVLSVRGVCRPKTKGNPFNAMASNYYLGNKPFPHFVDLEGNASFRADAFFSVGGWDDDIRFGHGGSELAYRLFQYDSDYAKQIYSPEPVIYHDFADNEHHLQSKIEKQSLSMDRLVKKYPDFQKFLTGWSEYYRQTNLIKLRNCESKDISKIAEPSNSNLAFTGEAPFVSVVIPTFNRSKLLEEALKSALNQTRPADEILVVDDDSTDDTAQVVERIGKDRVRYIHKTHSGAPATRNRGIAEARGDYILWLDDDDILMHDTIEMHMAIVAEDPNIDVVYGVLQEFDSISGSNIKLFDPKDWGVFPEMMMAAMMTGCVIPNPGTLVRRSAYDRLGNYDTSFDRAHDYDFWSRALTELKFKKNYGIVCRYRVHLDNMSTGGFIDRSFESRIMRSILKRYGLERVYHWLNWDKPDAARVVALFMASQSMLNIGDIHNAMCLLKTIPDHLQTIDIFELRLRALLYQGHEKAVQDFLHQVTENVIISDEAGATLRDNVQRYCRYVFELKQALFKADKPLIQTILQTMDRDGHRIPPDLVLALDDFEGRSLPPGARLKMLQTAVMQDPTNETLREKAMNRFSDEKSRDALDATRRRLLDPIVASQIEDTTHTNTEGLKAQNTKGYSKQPIRQDEKASNLYQDACKFYENENFHAAFESLGRAIAIQPDYWEAYVLLVNVMVQSGQEAAISHQLRSIEERSDLPARILALIGNGYEAGGHLDRAEGFATKALTKEAECACAWNLKGIIAYRRGDLEDASSNFKKAADMDDQWGEPWTNLGTIQWEQGFQDKALACFEKGFQLSPTAPNVITTYHIAISETGRFEHAKPIFENVIKAHPGFRKARFLLIDILIRIEAYPEALNQIEAVLVRFGADSQFLEAAKAIRAKNGPMTIGSRKFPSLSLCMIVKNEAQHLARCLESLKPIVDEMIIVDTGSNDNTRDIANVFGARVFEFEWNDDFSAARNFSLEQASGDWILIMDADEVIASKDHKKFRKILNRTKSNQRAFMIVTRNYTDQYNIVGWHPNLEQYPVEEAGAGWIPSEKIRLFPNDKTIRFEYPVHEVVGPALSRKGIPVESFPCPVHHYGKMDQNDNRKKDEHYYRIGMDKLSVSPDDPVAIREMAVQAAKLEKIEDSISLWKRFLELEPRDPRSYINLASCYGKLKQFQKAKNVAQIAISLDPDVKEAHLNLGLSELHLGKAFKAVRIFQRLVKKNKNYHSALFLLGAAQLCNGDIDEGMKSLKGLRGLSIWNNLSYSIQELVESLMAADWPELVLNLINGAKKLNCSNEKIREIGRLIEMKSTDQDNVMVA